MRLLLLAAVLFASASLLNAADPGRELIQEIVTEKDLLGAVIANARKPEAQAGFRKALLAKAPDSPKAIEALIGSLQLFVVAEAVQEGHRIEFSAVVGDINPKSRAFLLSQGVPAAFIEKTAAVVSVKLDGQELAGDALDALAAEIAKDSKAEKAAKPTKGESELTNLIFDKDIDMVVVVGARNQEWKARLDQLAASQPGFGNRIGAAKAALTHLVFAVAKKDGVEVTFALALGKIDQKVRAAFLSSGIPEAFIDADAALISVKVNGQQLKGDKLDEFAEALKAHR
ncbi:MAG: hypothetical protein ACR2KA_05830, partial [Opitutales bacterium]